MDVAKRVAVTVFVLSGLLAGSVQAAAIITNGTVTLGVRDLGDLNVDGGPPSVGDGTTVVGLRSNATGSDSTSPGCTCEGWGVGIKGGLGGGGADIAGFANSSVGNGNVSLVSFTSTSSTAVSVVNVGGGPGGAPVLQVTHNYHPIAGTNDLYEVTVSIQNVSGVDLTSGQLVYRRVMDWDIPTPGSEVVSLQGVPGALGLANGNNVLRTSNNGFNSSNPFSFEPDTGNGCGVFTSTNFTDQGPCDHGALFDFEFGALANGATRVFNTYYGVSATKAAADLARSLVDGDPSDVDIGLYSYGVCNEGLDGCNVSTGAPNTFIFGFGAVGGLLIPPGPGPSPPPNGVTEPGTLALLGLAMAGLAALRRRPAGLMR